MGGARGERGGGVVGGLQGDGIWGEGRVWGRGESGERGGCGGRTGST